MIIKRMMVKTKIDQRDTTNFLLDVKIKKKNNFNKRKQKSKE